LRTNNSKDNAVGAPAGTYEVTISPPLGADRRPLFATFTLPHKYQIEAKENDLEIRADPEPR
jgi:hypothetical protein